MHNRKHKRDREVITHINKIHTFICTSLSFCYWEIAVKFVLYRNVMLFGSLVSSDKWEVHDVGLELFSAAQLALSHIFFFILHKAHKCSELSLRNVLHKVYKSVNFLYICHFFTSDMTVMFWLTNYLMYCICGAPLTNIHCGSVEEHI